MGVGGFAPRTLTVGLGHTLGPLPPSVVSCESPCHRPHHRSYRSLQSCSFPSRASCPQALGSIGRLLGPEALVFLPYPLLWLPGCDWGLLQGSQLPEGSSQRPPPLSPVVSPPPLLQATCLPSLCFCPGFPSGKLGPNSASSQSSPQPPGPPHHFPPYRG